MLPVTASGDGGLADHGFFTSATWGREDQSSIADRLPGETALGQSGLDLQPLDGRFQVIALLFGRILGAMDPYDDQPVGVARFKLPQLRKDMDTVDSAIRPEVEQHQLPAQPLHR